MLKGSMFHLTMTKQTSDKLCTSEILICGRLKNEHNYSKTCNSIHSRNSRTFKFQAMITTVSHNTVFTRFHFETYPTEVGFVGRSVVEEEKKAKVHRCLRVTLIFFPRQLSVSENRLERYLKPIALYFHLPA